MRSESPALQFATACIHAGQEPDPQTGAVSIPIYANSTFAQSAPAVHKGYVYGRGHNPTRHAFERALAALEDGCAGYAFASGMAAISTLLDLLPAGAHILASDDLYGGTYRLFERVRAHSAGLQVSYIDLDDPLAIENSARPNTHMIWAESPTNPLMRTINLSRVAEIARNKGWISVMDNTFATPYFQRPLQMGFDLVMHSVTKYLGGHSDLIGGAVIARAEGELNDRIKFLHNAVGGVMGPFESFLALRGLKTLDVRMQRHHENGQKIADFLKNHAQVAQIFYPNYGGMISVRLRGSADQVKAFLSALNVFTLAESLGAVESLVNHPALMTHASIPPEIRTAQGIDDMLIRFSVGLEAADDLINDLKQAFKQAYQ
jgi:cystathionine gamma-lyase